MTRLAIIGIVIAATAYGAIKLYAPPPTVATTLTADEQYQQELTEAEAIRTCGVYDKPEKYRTSEIDGTVPLEECIQVNRSCQADWGPHAVWSGSARSTFDEAGTEKLVLNCSCDKGYEWLNTDGTIGGKIIPFIIDGLGRCVVQQ